MQNELKGFGRLVYDRDYATDHGRQAFTNGITNRAILGGES